MRKHILILLLCLFVCGPVFSWQTSLDTVSDLFFKANAFYGKSDFKAALSAYEEIISSGFKGGNLYFNAGNCYLEMKQIGKAIVNYERAKRFMPGDSALISNLKAARSYMKQADSRILRSPVSAIFCNFFEPLPVKWALSAIIALLYAGAILLTVSFFTRRFRMLLLMTAVFFFSLFFLTASPVIDKIQTINTLAVIISPITDAKIEPADDAETAFPLYEGMRVLYVEHIGGWVKIKRDSRHIGWIKREAVEEVNSY